MCGKASKKNDVEEALGSSSTSDSACTQGSDRQVDPCDDYTSRGKVCPDVVQGRLHQKAGGEVDLSKCKATGCRDIIPLRTFLRAAGLKDIDSAGDYKNQHGNIQSHRYAGLILKVNIV